MENEKFAELNLTLESAVKKGGRDVVATRLTSDGRRTLNDYLKSWKKIESDEMGVLAMAISQIKDEKKIAEDMEHKKYLNLAESSMRMRMLNLKRKAKPVEVEEHMEMLFAPKEIVGQPDVQKRSIDSEDVSVLKEHLGLEQFRFEVIPDPVKNHKDKLIKAGMIAGAGIVAAGLIGMAWGHIEAMVKNVQSENTEKSAVTWQAETPIARLPTLEPTNTLMAPTVVPHKLDIPFVSESEIVAPEPKIMVGGIDFTQAFSMIMPAIWDNLPGLGAIQPDWNLNPKVVTTDTDLTKLKQDFMKIGEDPTRVQIYSTLDDGVVIFGHAGNMNLSDLDVAWQSILGIDFLKAAKNARVTLPFERMRMAYAQGGEKAVQQMISRLNQDRTMAGFEVVDVKVVENGEQSLTNSRVALEGDKLVYIDLEKMGVDYKIANSGKPKVVYITCEGFDGEEPNGKFLVITTELRYGNKVEKVMSQSEEDALALEGIINGYAAKHKSQDLEELGEYIANSNFGQLVEERLDKKQLSKWEKALEFANFMTYRYNDEAIQCMVAAQLMYGLGEGTSVGIDVLGAADLLKEGTGFNKFITVDQALVGRNLVYPKWGKKMQDGRASGHVETFVGEVNFPSGKAYWVLRANGDQPATRYLIYEDELKSMLEKGIAVIVSLGNG